MATIAERLGVTPPVETAAERLGITPPPETAAERLGVTMPITAAEQIGLSPQHEDFAEKIVALRKNPLVNAALAAGQSFTQALENVGRSIRRGTRGITGTEILPREMVMPPVKFPAVPRMARPGVSAKIGRFIGEVAPYLLGGRLMAAERLGAEAPGYLMRTLRAVPGMAAYGAIQRPEAPVTGAAEYALGAPAGEAVAPVVGGIVEKTLAPIQFTKRTLQRILRRGYTKELYPAIRDRVNGVLDYLKGSSIAETSNDDLYSKLENNYNTATSVEDDLYRRLGTIDPKWKKAYDRTAYDNEIDNKVNAINKRINQFGEENPLSAPLKNRRQTLLAYKNTRLDNFDDADELKRALNQHIRELPYGDPLRADLPAIRNAARQTVEDSVKKSSESKPLLEAWKTADTHVRENVVPFRKLDGDKMSPFMQRYSGKKGISGVVSDYIKPNVKKDTTEGIENLFKNLQDKEGQNLAVYDLFKDTEENPTAFINRYKTLGAKQKKLLFPDNKEEMDNLVELQKKLPRAFKEIPEEIKEPWLRKAVRYATPAAIGAGAYGVARDLPIAAAAAGVPLLTRAALRQYARSPAGRRLMMEELRQPRIAGAVGRLLATRPARRIARGALATYLGGQQQ